MNYSKNYSFILFDLDGTLTDPYEGISNSIRYALSKYNIIEEDEIKLGKMIGPPLLHSLMKYYNFPERQAKEAIGYYREYFVERGIYENKVYEDIASLLKDLFAAGKILRLATSKPEIYAKKILEMFSLDGYFQAISGSTLDGSIIEKPQVVSRAIHDLNLKERETAIMVGDREYDIIGAAANNIDSIGVLYGFGTYEELKSANATFIVSCIEELRCILL